MLTAEGLCGSCAPNWERLCRPVKWTSATQHINTQYLPKLLPHVDKEDGAGSGQLKGWGLDIRMSVEQRPVPQVRISRGRPER